MDRQETFDKVWRHVIAQGRPATVVVQSRWGDDETKCVYHDKETGRKCAIGCLLTDKELAICGDFAGNVDSLSATKVPRFGDDLEFYGDLQAAHDFGSWKYDLSSRLTDYNYVDGFKLKMNKVAKEFDLKVPE